MPRARKKPPWEAIFCRIRAIHDARYWYPPRPTTAEFDAVGEKLGIRFPAGYRAFAQEFGLGGQLHVLPELFELTVPNGSSIHPWSHSVLNVTEFLRGFYAEDDVYDGPRELIPRMVVFARDGGQEIFVFDPAVVTDPRLNECRIYDIARDSHVEAIAGSFGEWLEWIDEHYRFEHEDYPIPTKPVYPLVMKPDSTAAAPMPYWPKQLRDRNAPAESEVRRWLAWNNTTVAQLARSIRIDNRTDAFPILADALEEAGCTNEDLLRAVAPATPTSTGAWALAVLLGPPTGS